MGGSTGQGPWSTGVDWGSLAPWGEALARVYSARKDKLSHCLLSPTAAPHSSPLPDLRGMLLHSIKQAQNHPRARRAPAGRQQPGKAAGTAGEAAAGPPGAEGPGAASGRDTGCAAWAGGSAMGNDIEVASTLALKTSRGGTSTASLDSLGQCLTTLMVKNFLVISWKPTLLV